MIQQRKLCFSVNLLIVGTLLAAAGEIVNLYNMNVLSSSWPVSLGLIVAGTFILLLGLSNFAAVSDHVSGFGFIGSNLLILGGLLLIVGTLAIDWIILPFLFNLAAIVASTINVPAIQTQDALNKIITTINGLGGPVLQKLFPGAVPHIPTAHIPLVNGIALVNKALIQLHLPTIESLQWWGHFSLSGGTLTVGSLILGLTLPHTRGRLTYRSIALIALALLNLLCQFLPSIPALWGNITAIGLFLTLAWIGIAALPEHNTQTLLIAVPEGEVVPTSREQVEDEREVVHGSTTQDHVER